MSDARIAQCAAIAVAVAAVASAAVSTRGACAAEAAPVADPVAGGITSFDGARLHVGGEPFFPFGLYWFDAEDVERYRRHRINVVYTQAQVGQLEAAAGAGLFVIASPASDDARLRRFAAEPHLIAWFLMDDADTEEEARICRERRARIRAIDTRRPLFASINGRDPEIDRRFRGIVDIYCPYRYPLPTVSFATYADWLDELREGFGVETLWTTIQSSHIYSKHRALGFTDLDLARAMEPAQLRLLVWTAVSAGARGILMWPERGLFDGREWTADRRAEVGILGSELEVVAPFLVEGTARPGGAVLSRRDVTVRRVDRGDASLLVLTKTGERYHLAVDAAVAPAVEVRVSGAAGAQAWSVSFPEPRPLPARTDGEDLLVTLDVEVTALVLVARDPGAVAPVARRMAAHLPDVAAFAESSAGALGEKVGDVLDKLARLGALPEALSPTPAPLARAIEGAGPSGGETDPAERYLAARGRARELRNAGAAARDHADAFVTFVPPEAAIHRLTVVTLPQYFSSFDVAAARAILDARR